MSEQSERLLKVILDSELSYVELEKKTGIAKSSIQRYASGTTKKIPIDAIKLIADATGGSAAWIMGWDDKMSPEHSRQTIDQQLEGVDFALYGEIKDLTEDEKQDILNFIKFTKTQRKK